MGFELCYLPDMPAALRAIAGLENSIERWWQQLEAARRHPEGSFKVINALAMAAGYDPDPARFLGERDQSDLLYGVHRFVQRLNELGIPHRYEEFPDNHTAVDYRMDESLPFLARALTG
jgi:hypothetical protein